jgi:hypothetical protein
MTLRADLDADQAERAWLRASRRRKGVWQDEGAWVINKSDFVAGFLAGLKQAESDWSAIVEEAHRALAEGKER